jgi:hypothetical protein
VALQSAATWDDRRYLDMSLLKEAAKNENEAA